MSTPCVRWKGAERALGSLGFGLPLTSIRVRSQSLQNLMLPVVTVPYSYPDPLVQSGLPSELGAGFRPSLSHLRTITRRVAFLLDSILIPSPVLIPPFRLQVVVFATS